MSGTVPNRTPILRFTAREAFQFRQGNAAAIQTGRGGGRAWLTTSDLFVREMVMRHPAQFRIDAPRHSIGCEPVARWRELDLAGKRVAFLLPSQALGSNVATLLAIEALQDRWKLGEIAVFCAKSAADIYALARRIKVFPYWIGEDELARFDHVFDLGQIEARRDIEIWPVDMEAEILEAFGVAPSARYPADPHPMRPRVKPRLGIFPLGSSPLRTLPIAATRALAQALAGHGELRLYLNRGQMQGQLYAAAFADEPVAGLDVIDGFDTIGGLMQAIRTCDWAVFADSGPAHISKLFRTPGIAVYTSAPGDVLQGRFRNLAHWTVPFAGPHCRAPCGLAKVRSTVDGRVGCMGSLSVTLADLPAIARSADPAAVEEMLLRRPVPCVAALGANPAPLVDAALAALAQQRVA